MTNAQRSYVLFDSPLRTARGKACLGGILAAAFLLAALGIYSLGLSAMEGVLEWSFYPALGCVATFFILSFLDRKRGFWQIRLSVVLYVAMQSTFIAAFFNSLSPFQLQTVGFIEEGAKIFPVVLSAVFLPNTIRTRKDAMVLGGMAGIGFNLTEIAVYISQTLIKGNYSLIETLYLHSTRLAILGFGVHVIWSMVTGLGLGMAVESDRKGFRRWIPFVAVYLIVALTHSAYDSGMIGIALVGSIVVIQLIKGNEISLSINVDDAGHPGTLRESMILEHYLYNVIYIAILIRQFFRSAGRELEMIAKELGGENGVVITESELSILLKEGRWGYRRYPELPKKVSKRIVKLQNLFATQKATLKKLGEPLDGSAELDLLRNEIAEMRS